MPLTPGRIRTGILGVIVAAIAALALSVAPAQATTGHISAGPFGVPNSNDPGGFQFGGPAGVVVDQATGDVFATDPNHSDSNGAAAPRVERFDSTGAFVSEFPIDPTLYNGPQAIAIDPNGGGELYVGANDVNAQGAVLKFKLDGTPDGTLTPDAGTLFNPSALAVDPTTGDVYVGASDANGAPIVEVFDNTGLYQSFIDGTNGSDAFFSVNALAVDGNSRVYVSDGGHSRVVRFSAAGAFEATVVDGGLRGITPGALAVDPTNDEVYVVENNSLVEYLSAGGADHLDVFNPFGASITGIAVNAGSGTVYLADSGQTQGLIATAVAGPTVETTGASAVGTTSATLEGTVDPEGDDASYHFEYGLDTNYGSGTNDGAASGAGPVSSLVEGLLPNSTYHFRIIGSNPNTGATITGADATFTTDAAPPIVDGSAPFASDITSTGAQLNVTVNPQGTSTDYHVEYGTTTGYGSTVAGAAPLDGQGDQTVPVPVTGLAPGTVYHFRVVANNGVGGDQAGADATFKTAPAAAAGASSVSAVSAELTGTVDPRGRATTYHFEYGESGFDKSTNDRSAGSSSALTTVTASIDGLKPGTTYHVRAVAIDSATGVKTTGVGGTFTTDPAASVATGDVTGVTPTAATFSGHADTHGLGGTYRFYVESSTSTYTSSTTPTTIPAGSGPGDLSGTLTDLLPGQTYTVRLAVLSSGYTSFGDAVTFTTAPRPEFVPPPPPPTVANPYGCVAPVLKAYDAHPKPGDTITVAGTDLGVGGTVALGGGAITPTSWSAGAITIVLPDDAKGSLPLTINCGKASNTIAIQMFQAPSNRITSKAKVSKATATLTLKVPGPGDIKVTGAGVKTVKRHVGKAGTYTVKAALSASGKKSLRRHKSLARTLTISFKPNGGTTAKKTVKVTYRR